MLHKIKRKITLDDTHLNDLLKGASLAFVIKIYAAGISYLLSLIIAKMLGAEQAGYYFLGMTVLVVVATLGRLGYDNALIRFVSAWSSEGSWQKINGLYVRVQRLIISVVLPVSLLIHFNACFIAEHLFLKPAFCETLSSIIVSGTAFSLVFFHSLCMQGLKRIGSSMLLQSALIPTILVALLLLLNPVTAAEVARLYMYAALAALAISWAIWWRMPQTGWARLDAESAVEVNRTLPDLFFVIVMALVVQWACQLMLGVWADAEDIALYAIANRTAMLISFFLYAVNSISAPKFSELHQAGNMEGLRRMAVGASRALACIAFPMLVIMIVFAEYIVLLFGEEFKEAAPVLVILMLGQFFNVMTGSVGYLLQMTGHEKALRKNVMISSFFLLVCGLIFIPLYGLLAAAWIGSIAMILKNGLNVYTVYVKLKINTLAIWQKL